MNFVFPDNGYDIAEAESKTMLKSIFSQLIQRSDFKNSIRYSFREVQDKYLYVSCRYCQCKVKYKKQGGIYHIFSLQQFHSHPRTRGNHADIQKYLEKLPETISVSDAYKILRLRGTLSISTFYRIYNATKNKQFKISEMFDKFKRNQIIGHYQPLENDENPSLIIFSTPAMKKQFQKFGDSCSFDLTYHLVRTKSFNNHQYGVGFFVGLNNMMKIIPFAVVITDQQNKERMAKIFYQFFKLMGNLPSTIVTDQQASIEAGLKILEYENIWKGVHLYDWFHILRNVKKKLIRKERIKYFSELIKAENQPEFKTILAAAEEEFGEGNDDKVLEKFINNARRYCFSLIPPKYVGLTVSSSICQKTNDLIKKKIPLSKQLNIVLKKCWELCEQLLNKGSQAEMENNPIEMFFHSEEISKLRQILCKKVLKRVLLELSKTPLCMIQTQSLNHYVVTSRYGTFSLQKREQSIQCSCEVFEKSGIHCYHMIRIGQLLGLQLSSLINSRWIITPQTKETYKRKVTFPKKTRRRQK